MAILFGRNQFTAVLAFLVCGVLCGALFDALKVKRHLFGSPGVILFADDLLFMLSSGILLIFCAFAFNDGNFKWYETPCMLTGFGVYRLTLSRPVIWVLFAVIDGTKKLIKRLLRPVLRLFCRFGRAVFLLWQNINRFLAEVRLQKHLEHGYPLFE